MSERVEKREYSVERVGQSLGSDDFYITGAIGDSLRHGSTLVNVDFCEQVERERDEAIADADGWLVGANDRLAEYLRRSEAERDQAVADARELYAAVKPGLCDHHAPSKCTACKTRALLTRLAHYTQDEKEEQ